MAEGLFRKRRHSVSFLCASPPSEAFSVNETAVLSIIANTRIYIGIEEINQQIDEHKP
jgi:hypothetical protein